jgi:hypothetical protein
MISGFRHKADEIRPRLKYYAAYNSRRFGLTYRSNLEWSRNSRSGTSFPFFISIRSVMSQKSADFISTCYYNLSRPSEYTEYLNNAYTPQCSASRPQRHQAQWMTTRSLNPNKQSASTSSHCTSEQRQSGANVMWKLCGHIIIKMSPIGCVCVCVCVCDLETSKRCGLGPIWDVEPQRKIIKVKRKVKFALCTS